MNVEQGGGAGTFPWNKTEEREAAFYIPKQTIIKDEGVCFHLKATPFDWNNLHDPKKYRVGVTLVYKQEKTYAESGIVADAAPLEELNIKKMLIGRIDPFQTRAAAVWAT